MSADHLAVAIGGSGARSAEALVYLCAAGLGPTELTIIIADADTQNFSVGRAIEAIGLYQQLQGAPNFRGASPLFQTTLAEPKKIAWSPFPVSSDITLEGHFGHAAMAMAGAEGQRSGARLMEALYSHDQRTAALNVGFRGKPSLGAAICDDTLDMTEAPWDEILSRLTENSGRQQASWVFGMGSVFGGMGAAGLPVIPSQLKASVPAGNEHVRLGAALLLPYFTFPPPPAGNTETVYALAELFALNSREALRYYNDQNEGFNDFYVVGTKATASQPVFALGSKGQANRPHFIELVTGLSALRFFQTAPGTENAVHLLAVRSHDSFGWEDVPDVSRVQPALNNLARSCAFYLAVVFPVLRMIHDSAGASHRAALRTPWYRDLVEKRGMQPSDSEQWKWFQTLQLFAVRFLCWLRDVQEHSGAVKLDLVRSQSLGLLSETQRDLSPSPFESDLLRQGIKFPLGDIWRKFCHVCAANPGRELPNQRAFLAALHRSSTIE